MALNYQDYVKAVQKSQEDPNFVGPGPMSEEDWNKLAPKDQYSQIIAHGADFGPGGWLKANGDQLAAYTSKFGAPTGQLVFGYGDPSQFGKGPEAWAFDPNKIVKLPDGSWVMDSANVDQNKFGALQKQDDQSGINLTPAKMIAMVLGAGGLGNLALGGDLFGGATAGTFGAEDTGLNMGNAFSGVPSGVAGTSEDIGLNMANQFPGGAPGAPGGLGDYVVGQPGVAAENPSLYSAVTGGAPPSPYTPYTGPSDPYSVMSGIKDYGPGAFDTGINGGGPSSGVFDGAGNSLYQPPSLWDQITANASGLGSRIMSALPALATGAKMLAPKPTGGPGAGGPGGMGGASLASHAQMPAGHTGTAEIDPYTKLRNSTPIKTLGDYLKGM